ERPCKYACWRGLPGPPPALSVAGNRVPVGYCIVPRLRRSPDVHFPAMRRYHVTTFGCQMNPHDSERIRGLLEELGLGEASSPDDADVLVFNTCTIREKPDQR